MRRHCIFAFAYAIAAMACGVFYREFTKFNDFTGVTALGKVHTHLFMLGMAVFLFVALFDAKLGLRGQKLYKPFLILYNIGVPLASVMMLVLGVLQVAGTALSSGADAAISGVAGIGHVLAAAGLVLFFCMLLRGAKAADARSAPASGSSDSDPDA